MHAIVREDPRTAVAPSFVAPLRRRPARDALRHLACAATVVLVAACSTGAPVDTASPPDLRVDASWPKPLPNGWILGAVAGVATDADDHVWVLQRPGTLTDDERGATFRPPLSDCCAPAKPVLEFDAAGNLLRSWGGPAAEGSAGYDWPRNEHGIHVDAAGFVWITGNGELDGQVLKFTRDGRFVLQIGKVGPQTGNLDTSRLGQPAGVEVDGAANEVYVADGYYNRRIIVFDATTGAFKRMWSAFGRPPVDAAKPELRRTEPPTDAQLAGFGNPVHCVRVAHDGLVYVCDRLNDRVQVFTRDGRYVKQFFVAPWTAGNGSTWDIALSRDPEQRWIFLADGRNDRIATLVRETGAVVGKTGGPGRYAGQFHWVHDIAVDSRGNVYAGEVDTGKRVQKFVPR